MQVQERTGSVHVSLGGGRSAKGFKLITSCRCSGSYYGNQCELDGEVLGVAIGASVAAVIIIGATLVCLVMWSRRWSREQKAAIGSPVFGYMASASNTVKAPVVGGPPYQLTLEDRVRWAQIADAMAQSNHYAVSPRLSASLLFSSRHPFFRPVSFFQPEPVTGPTRPSSAVFGYPTLSLAGTLPSRPIHGTLPPIPMPRLSMQGQLGGKAASVHGMRPLDNSSSSEEEDKTDLLGRSFQVPRPKSRSNASVAVSLPVEIPPRVVVTFFFSFLESERHLLRRGLRAERHLQAASRWRDPDEYLHND